MAATDAGGERFKERVSLETPTPREVAAFGDGYQSTYVQVSDEHGTVTLYGRSAGGAWSVIAADVDAETAGEVGRWFDLVEHLPGRTPAGVRNGAPIPEGEPMAKARAVSLVVERIRARRLDYPTEGLAADRFAGGWSVYAPVDVDESDPMAFLDMPVGRSVFLVGDTGRVKETSSSVPPQMAEEMFTAEEAYVRRRLDGEEFMADLQDEVARLSSGAEGPAGIASFTVETPSEAIAARAQALLGPIAQQLALLGPPGWDSFTATFSFTVSGEVAQLRFRSAGRDVEVLVPEQTALLVRRQRHLAARMPAGPWWRLLLSLGHTAGTNAVIATEYDYGDRPFPDDHLLAPGNYRDDLAAYPRAQTPAWLSAYAAGGRGPGPASPPAPRAAAAPAPAPAPSAAPSPARSSAPPAEYPVLDTTVGGKRLHADPRVITYGRKSIALDEVEWVGFSATRVAEKRFMFPTFYTNTWQFQVGRYPYYGGPKVSVLISKGGREAEQPAEWAFLVNLVGRYLEPRLLGDLVTRVRRGETVTVGGSIQVARDGIACPKPRFSLPWTVLGPVQFSNGMILIHQAGSEKPLLRVPLSHPNAVLIPDLFTALASA
ncbi:hypothetical protein [Actinacidiphila bryophytorum]|nr:hypothetical protein [Actinacidiphila bryophytorum]MBM9440311.1 hypothetical protein [Actinacidiphila bryophytorum]